MFSGVDYPGECRSSTCVCAGAITECHSTLEEGAPIACEVEAETGQAECVSLICALDNYCCCVGWDFTCVDEVNTKCNAMPL